MPVKPITTFQDLANEIIIKIIQFCRPAHLREARITLDTLRNLRLVSPRLNSLVSPILFATLRLDFYSCNSRVRWPGHSRCDEILIALATRSTTSFDHTIKLVIRLGILFKKHEIDRSGILQTERYLKERIFDIISALKNLQSIEYFYDQASDPEQLVADLFKALATLPSFTHLDISLLYIPVRLADIPRIAALQPFSNLTVFRGCWNHREPNAFLLEIASLLARCPNMTELTLHQLNQKDGTLQQILQGIDKLETEWNLERLALTGVMITPEDIKDHIRHFRNLSFLEISSNDNPEASTTFGRICLILQENKTFLRGVSTDHPEDPLLLQYLSSYSGLKELSLRMVYGPIENESAIIEQCYMCIIPNNIETLEHLDLWRREIPKKEHLAEIVKCRNLQSLEVHSKIDLEELMDESNNDLEVYISSLNARSLFEGYLFD